MIAILRQAPWQVVNPILYKIALQMEAAQKKEVNKLYVEPEAGKRPNSGEDARA